MAMRFGLGGLTLTSPLISADRLTTWQPGVTYNGGIPTNRTQSGSTINPIGQVASFTGTVINGSNTLTVSGLTGTLGGNPLICDGSLTTCFGFIASGSAATWTLNDTARMSSGTIAMVAYGNDGVAIATAFNGASSNTYVQLSNGLFFAAGNGIFLRNNNVTLRGGTGQWTGTEITTGNFPPTSPSSTIIWKADNSVSPWGLLYPGQSGGPQAWINSINFASDGVKGTKTATLTGSYGGSVGDLVLVDMTGGADSDVWWGNRHELSGYFNGSLSGGSLTVNSIQQGALGFALDLSFNGTLNGTALTINSSATGGYVQAGFPFGTQLGISIFDGSGTFKGYTVSGGGTSFTLSQSNGSFTGTLYLGGICPLAPGGGVPQYPVYDSVFSTFYGFIQSGTFPNLTLDRSTPTLSNVNLTVGGGTRRFFSRQDRPVAQMMKIAALSADAKTVTFETVFHKTFKAAYAAQISNPTNGFNTGIGVENLTLYYGKGGDGNSNLPFVLCSNSWAKNVQALFGEGTGIGFYNCYRCEMRECYTHSSWNPNPGGAGYVSGMNNATADSLFENNIMWGGNKVDVMRGTGGGNVIAYNYMDDSFGAGYPMSPEAGVNAGHYMCPHFELLEGNYSAQHQADSFWGNSIYITVFRNWITGLRAAANIQYNFSYSIDATNASSGSGTNTLTFTTGVTDSLYTGLVVKNLSTYGVIPANTTVTGTTTTTVTLSHNITGAGVGNGDIIEFDFVGTLNNYKLVQSFVNTYPYIDSWGRTMNLIEANNYNYSICANVLGYSGQGYRGFNTAGNYNQDPAQGGVGYVYENLGTIQNPTGSDIEIWNVGEQQDPGQTIQLLHQDATLQRDGNWDWFTQSQRWHGVGGAVGSRAPVPIPNSYYLSGPPAFWGNTTWPWVDPSTGTTYTLPAKARFQTMTGLTPIPPGNQ